jgi:Flp pilus assembly pilin Flp
MTKLSRLIGREDGQTMAEYSTVLAVITLTCVTAFLFLAGGAQQAYERAATLFG